jgi:sugar/nucleoside kinase (ribokinase family)
MRRKSKLDCVIAGEANIDLLMDGVLYLEPGTEKLVNRMDVVLGGSSGITAHNLARLGTKVGFVGVLGNDSFGQIVEHRLRSAGVDLSALRREPKERTGITVWLSENGKRAGVTYTGTIAMLRPADITEAYLAQARHFHVGHYFLLEKLHSSAAKLFRRAKELGLTTSTDCNYDPTERWDSNLRKVLPHLDIFFPNDAEAMKITGAKDVPEAARLLGESAKIVVVKMGAEGAYVYTAGKGFQVPAVKTKVVDTTGAGDSFNAGFLSKFLQGASLEQCARFGAKTAARSVTRVGGTAAFEKK